jgi:hypothetical protein
MSRRIVCEESHGSVPVPYLERRRLVLALAMRPLELENRVPGGDDEGDVSVGKRFLRLEAPLRRTLLDERREARVPGSV